MYCEQMMREQGFDDGAELPADPLHRRDLAGLPDHPRRPDAPRRDVASTRRPTSSSSTPASRTPNARAEVHRYTYTPTYQLSYLLGKVLLLQLRADEQRRLGPTLRPARRSTTRCSTTARCRSASTAGSSARRCARPRRPAAPVRRAPRATDRAACRSSRRSTSSAAARGSSSGRARRPASARRPTGRTGSPSSFVELGAPARSTSSTSTAPGPAQPGEPRGGRGDRVAGRRPDPARRRPRRADGQIRLAFAAGATRVVLAMGVVDEPRRPRAPASRSPATGWRSGSTRGRSGSPRSRGAGRGRRRSRRSSSELVGARRARGSSCRTAAREPDAALVRDLARTVRCRRPRRRRRHRPRRRPPRCAMRGVAGIILGEALLSGAIDYPAALEAAA